jgi:hypothetical protein
VLTTEQRDRAADVRRAVLDASFDGVREGLAYVPPERRDRWAAWLNEAEAAPPHHFSPNGFVVHGWPGLTADDLVELAVRTTG